MILLDYSQIALSNIIVQKLNDKNIDMTNFLNLCIKNKITSFKINKYYNLRHLRSRQYETVKDFYLNGGLDKDGSPLDSFEFLKYLK